MASRPSTPSQTEVLEATQRWIKTCVVGWQLCPFAAPVIQHETLRIQISEASDFEALYQEFLQEMLTLFEAPPTEIATTLLVAPCMFAGLMPFLEFVAIAEEAIEQAGLEGTLQLAFFHPRNLFDGEPRDDESHYAGRAPYPTLHLLRTEQVTEAIEGPIDTTQLPARNTALLRQKGKAALQQLFERFYENS